MPVQPLPLLEAPFELTKPAKMVQKKCNAQAIEFNQKLAKFDEAVAAAVETEPDEIGSLADVADKLEHEKLDLLVEERKLRMLMGEYFKQRRDSWEKATDVLHLAHEAARERVHQALLAAGYVDGPIPGGYQECIVPLFYMHHPECRLLKQNYDACRSSADDPHEALNRERIEYIDGEIRAVRDRLMRSVRR